MFLNDAGANRTSFAYAAAGRTTGFANLKSGTGYLWSAKPTCPNNRPEPSSAWLGSIRRARTLFAGSTAPADRPQRSRTSQPTGGGPRTTSNLYSVRHTPRPYPRQAFVEAGGERVTWTYDRTYQLLTEARSGAGGNTHTFSYDPVGNRLTKDDGTTVTTSVYDDANRLQTAEDGSGVTTYTFDANGNERTIETPSGDLTTYTWDYENQMSSAEDPLGEITTYVYTAAEQRVEKETDAETVKFLWDGQNIVQEYDEFDVTQADYTNDPQPAPQPFGNLVSQHRDTESSFYHFDALGSTRDLTDSAEVETDDYTFEAFGKVAASSGTTENPFQWVGAKGVYTQEDERRWMRAREMDATSGRFMSEDPARDDSNLYRYTGNNPASSSDPSGLQEGTANSDGALTEYLQAVLAMEEARTDGMALTLDYLVALDLGDEVSAKELLPDVTESEAHFAELSQTVDAINNTGVEINWPPDSQAASGTPIVVSNSDSQVAVPDQELEQAILAESVLQAELMLQFEAWQEVSRILIAQRNAVAERRRQARARSAAAENAQSNVPTILAPLRELDEWYSEVIAEVQGIPGIPPYMVAPLEMFRPTTYQQAAIDITLVGLPNAAIGTLNLPMEVRNWLTDELLIDPILENDYRARYDPEYAETLRQHMQFVSHGRTIPEVPLSFTEGWVSNNPNREATALIGGEALFTLLTLYPEALIEDALRAGTTGARAIRTATAADELVQIGPGRAFGVGADDVSYLDNVRRSPSSRLHTQARELLEEAAELEGRAFSDILDEVIVVERGELPFSATHRTRKGNLAVFFREEDLVGDAIVRRLVAQHEIGHAIDVNVFQTTMRSTRMEAFAAYERGFQKSSLLPRLDIAIEERAAQIVRSRFGWSRAAADTHRKAVDEFRHMLRSRLRMRGLE